MKNIFPRARLAGVAIGVLAALMLIPSTRWILRSQTRLLLGFDPTVRADTQSPFPASFPEERWKAMLKDRPNDVAMHMAHAIRSATSYVNDESKSVLMEFEPLIQRFPNEPSVYAAALRAATMREVTFSRPGDSDRLSGRSPEGKGDQSKPPPPPRSPDGKGDPLKPPPSPEVLALFDRYAARGEQLDPDNAFFPAMRAIGHFAGGNDEDASRDFLRAGGKARWHDYVQDEVRGLWKVSELRGEGSNTLERMASAYSVLLPHMAMYRTSARAAILHALDLEEAGRTEDGIALRLATARTGSLMRQDGSYLITNLVGIAVTKISILRPGGAPALRDEKGVAGDQRTSDDRNALDARRLSTLSAYLEQNGHAQDAQWYRNELAKGEKVLKIARTVSPTMTREGYRVISGWLAGQFLLANAIWTLLLAGVAALSLRGFDYLFGKTEVKRRPAQTLLTLVIVALMLVFVKIITAIQGQAYSRGLTSWAVGNDTGEQWGNLFLLGVVIPAVLLLVVSVITKIKGTDSALVRFVRAAVPTAFVLFLLYGGTVLFTARETAIANQVMEKVVQHEGRYFAMRAGEPWPE